MKRLLTTLSLKWPEYLLEILVLIIGIYGAFALDNWNNERLQNELEKKYLKSINTDLGKDLEQLDLMYQYRENASKIAFKMLRQEEVDNSFEDYLAFTKNLADALFWWEFTPNDNTFQELISSGSLSILQNDTIRNGLLNLEALNNEISEQRAHMRRDYDHYLYDEVFQLDQFDLFDYKHILKTRKVDYLNGVDNNRLEELVSDANALLKNKKVRNGWKLIILNNSSLLDLYDEMKTEIDRIQKEIRQ